MRALDFDGTWTPPGGAYVTEAKADVGERLAPRFLLQDLMMTNCSAAVRTPTVVRPSTGDILLAFALAQHGVVRWSAPPGSEVAFGPEGLGLHGIDGVEWGLQVFSDDDYPPFVVHGNGPAPNVWPTSLTGLVPRARFDGSVLTLAYGPEPSAWVEPSWDVRRAFDL